MQDEMNDLQYTKPEDPDIVKVVRCNDCRYFNDYFVSCDRQGRWIVSIGDPLKDYCSKGVRRDE